MSNGHTRSARTKTKSNYFVAKGVLEEPHQLPAPNAKTSAGVDVWMIKNSCTELMDAKSRVQWARKRARDE